MKVRWSWSVLLAFLLLACQPPPRNEMSSSLLSVKTEDYQIGSAWNRSPVSRQKSYAQSIVEFRSEFNGTQGVGIYLGQRGDEYLFLTNRHILGPLDTCSRFVHVRHVSGRVLMSCSRFVASFNEVDLSLVMMKPHARDLKLKLVPLRFSEAPLFAGQPLKLRTIDAEKREIVEDSGGDCLLFDSRPHLLFDPDKWAPVPTPSWSLPIGCDAIHRDSGAPVFNSEDHVVGILWTGKYPKKSKTSDEIHSWLKNENDRIWTDLNYMVPISSLMEEIGALEETGSLDKEDLKIIKSLF